MNRLSSRRRDGSSLLAAGGVMAMLLSAGLAAGAELGSEAKTLARLDEEWSKAAATKDAERVASYYAEDATAYPPSEPIVVGKTAAKKVWASYFAIPGFSISWKTTHAEVTRSGDLGFTSGTYQASSKGADGKLATENGKYVCIWKKQANGSWKAIHDIWNTDSK
jgi:ketosteroid isomerase-like protein